MRSKLVTSVIRFRKHYDKTETKLSFASRFLTINAKNSELQIKLFCFHRFQNHFYYLLYSGFGVGGLV